MKGSLRRAFFYCWFVIAAVDGEKAEFFLTQELSDRDYQQFVLCGLH